MILFLLTLNLSPVGIDLRIVILENPVAVERKRPFTLKESQIMGTMLLRNPEVLPGKEILQEALDGSYPAFDELMNTISTAEYSLTPEWNYYNDGKAWLCKVIFKKKTVFWLSVWEGYFKATFYFTEKNCGGLDDLDLNPELMQQFIQSKPIGKLMPMLFTIREAHQLEDLLKVVQYKKNLK